jgi:predicted metal-binding membrane protein
MDVEIVRNIAPVVALVGTAGMLGWVITTWLRVRHGYPLDGAWGQAIYPKSDTETTERMKLLTQENAQLRAELGSMKDRLSTVERIVTDSGYHLTQDIERLRDGSGNVQ